MKSDLEAGNPIDFAGIATHLRGEAELTLLSELSLSEDVDNRIIEKVDEWLGPLERQYIDRRKLEIQREIAEAVKRGDDATIDQLDAEKLRLSRRSNQLDTDKGMSNALK